MMKKPAPKINPGQAFIVKYLKYCISKAYRQKERTHILLEYEFFYGCGGRIRTNDLRVMSPTSYQLLYPAIFSLLFSLINIAQQMI